MAGKSAPKATRKKIADWGQKLLQGFKPIEAGLFGLGGYYLGDVLNSTGLPSLLYDTVPIYKNWIDRGFSSGVPNAQVTFNYGGGQAITKVAGVGTFAAVLAKAAKSGLSPKALNSTLPFSIGAMLDGPLGGADAGVAGVSTGGDRWSA